MDEQVPDEPTLAEYEQYIRKQVAEEPYSTYARGVVRDLFAEVDRLRAQRAAALARHTPDARMGHDDVRCMSCPDEAWPCPTFTALDGETQSR